MDVHGGLMMFDGVCAPTHGAPSTGPLKMANTLVSVSSLASLLYGQGKLAEAEPLFREAFEGKQKDVGS